MLDELSRRKIFWLLKRWSSYTYWHHILDTRQAFLDAITPQVEKHPQDNPSELAIKIYKGALSDVVNIEKGLKRLLKGDRSPFHRHSSGYFTKDSFGHGWFLSWVYREALDNQLEYIDDVLDAKNLYELAKIAGSDYTFGYSICELGDRDKSAWWYPAWILLPQNLPKHPFPDTLSEMSPPPKREIEVKSGEKVPTDGIYETGIEGTCANYLLGGTRAPLVIRDYGFLSEAPIGDGQVAMLPELEDIPATWRLIWQDDRYKDGKIPEEEKEYFLPFGDESTPSEESIPEKLRAMPGERCICEGYWWTPSKEKSRRYFKRDETFPDYPNTEYGTTVWYFDRVQDS